jgi:Kef-type K+ transport system membrane component KefB
MSTNLDIFITVLLAVTFILIGTYVISNLVAKTGQPRVVGEMISGVLLGPTVLGAIFPSFSAYIFPVRIMPFLFLLSNIGLCFYMFLVGLELDFKLIDKKLFNQSIGISLASIVIPFVSGILVAGCYFPIFSGGSVSRSFFMIFIGTALSITAFPMMARILEDTGLIKTKVGALVMFSASIQDVISWIILAFVVSAAKGFSAFSGVITLVSAFIFTFLIFYIIRPFLAKLTRHIADQDKLSGSIFTFIIILLLACSIITDKMGLYSVFGSFLLGLAVPNNEVLKRELNAKLKDITLCLLLPLFFTFSGLNTDLRVLSQIEFLIPTIIIILVAFLSKYLSSLGAMRFYGYPFSEASAMGGLFNARGLMELIIINIGLTYGIINKAMYSVLVLVAIITTLLAMPIFNYSRKTNN